MWQRLILLAAGSIAALFLARDAPSFGVVEAMIGIALIAAITVVLALFRRR